MCDGLPVSLHLGLAQPGVSPPAPPRPPCGPANTAAHTAFTAPKGLLLRPSAPCSPRTTRHRFVIPGAAAETQTARHRHPPRPPPEAQQGDTCLRTDSIRNPIAPGSPAPRASDTRTRLCLAWVYLAPMPKHDVYIPLPEGEGEGEKCALFISKCPAAHR